MAQLSVIRMPKTTDTSSKVSPAAVELHSDLGGDRATMAYYEVTLTGSQEPCPLKRASTVHEQQLSGDKRVETPRVLEVRVPTSRSPGANQGE